MSLDLLRDLLRESSLDLPRDLPRDLLRDFRLDLLRDLLLELLRDRLLLDRLLDLLREYDFLLIFRFFLGFFTLANLLVIFLETLVEACSSAVACSFLRRIL